MATENAPATAEQLTTAAVHSNPHIDALLWGGWRWNGTINYYFDTNDGWFDVEKDAYRSALQSWSNVANISFNEVGSSTNANFVENLYVAAAGNLGQHDTPQHANAQGNKAYGYYNIDGYGWDEFSSSGGLQKGGLGHLTLVHELGHALGLAHPHDNGGGSGYFPGVTPNDNADTGDYGLNHDIYTVMSYVHGLGLSKTLSFVQGQDFYGYAAGPMAFDIAAIQFLYGANMNYKTGDNSWTLPGTNSSGTFWSCIWDAGGNDTIDFNGSGNALIDLRAATLTNSANGGGYISRVDGIYGGFTIANGVIIENARGGSGNDTLNGNDWNNSLYGRDGSDGLYGMNGNDLLSGGSGNDFLRGGLGGDTVYGGSNADVFNFHTTSDGGDYMPDWNQADDAVYLTRSGFGFGGSGTQAFTTAGGSFQLGTSASGGLKTVLWDKTTGKLQFDADGAGGSQKVLLATVIVEKASTTVDSSWHVNGSGDFNGDGDSDVVWRNTSGECLIWEMQGNNRVNGYLLGDVDSSWSLAAFGDFTGDGTSDVLWHNTVSGEVLNWKMAGHQKDNGFLLGYIDPSWAVDGCGDFNGDGTDDFIFRNKISNESVVWTMNNGVKTNGYGLGVIDNSWKFSGAGDFNNDGTDDVSFRNSITGELLLWKMQGGQKDNGFLLGQIDKSWDIASTMDTNSNGTDDITWHNSQSGEVLTWTVSNMQKQNGSLSCVVGSNWDAVGTGDFNSNNVADLLWWDASGKLITSQFNDWNQANFAAGDIFVS